MKWRDFDRLVEILRAYVPQGPDRRAAEIIIELELGEYRRVQYQAQIHRKERDPGTGRILPRLNKKRAKKEHRRKAAK